MKPIPIAEYLDHIGQMPSGGRQVPRGGSLPFRLRSVAAAETANVAAVPGHAPDEAAANAVKANIEDRRQHKLAAWPAARRENELSRISELTCANDIEARVAEAYERGFRDGELSARAESEERRVKDLTAQQEKNEAELREFQMNECAQLAGLIEGGLIEIEQRIASSVTRILTPFIEERLTRQVVEDLCQEIARLRAGSSPSLARIRGPEILLARLCQRISSLPIDVEYLVEDRFEVRVEAGDTVPESDLEPWTRLLAEINA
jgi:hypothetical protein